MKTDKKTVILTTLVCLLPIIAGAILYPQLPERIITHWGVNGEPNGWSSRAFAVFGLPGILLVVNFFLPFSMRTDPKYANMNPKLRTICLWIIPLIAVLCSAMTLGTAMGYQISVGRIAPAICGVIFIVIGNLLPKTKQSYTMGIKLPWTLNSEENWNRTHRVAGFLWVICGAVFLLLTLLDAWTMMATVVLLAAAILVPAVYSYILYRRGI